MLILILLSPSMTFGAENKISEPSIINGNLKFIHIGIGNGLSSNLVNKIYKDSRGFMWFGTWNGLDRYDGYRITEYRHDNSDPESISANAIFSIAEDSEGNIWVGTNYGISRYNREAGTFTTFLHDPEDSGSISSDYTDFGIIAADKAGDIIIATDKGFDKYIPENGTFQHYKVPGSKRELRYAKHSDRIWFISDKYFLENFDPGTGKIKRFPSSRNDNDMIMSLTEDSEGNIWLCRKKGILEKFNPETEKFLSYDISNYSKRLKDILFDSRGILWIVTDNRGAARFNKNNNSLITYRKDITDSYSISDDRLKCVYEDDTGLMWFGSVNSGVNILNMSSQYFTLHKHNPSDNNSLGDNTVWALYKDSRDLLWIGHNKGLDCYDEKTNTFTHYVNDPTDPYSITSGGNVSSISEDPDGNLWIGVYGGGVDYMDLKTGRFYHHRHDPDNPESVHSNAVIETVITRSGDLWVGSSPNGLDRFDRDTGKFIHYGRPDVSVNTFFEDFRSRLWFGSWRGILGMYDRETDSITLYRFSPNTKNTISQGNIQSVYGDGRGIIWIGMSTGLNSFDPDTGIFSRYTSKDGLEGEFIMGILEDSRGNLWLSTNRGISSFDPDKRKFKNYGQWNGLPDGEFIQTSCTKSRDGKMYFGNSKGFVTFYPRNIKANTHIPPVAITGFYIFNKPVQPGPDSPLEKPVTEAKSVSLSHSQNVFSIEFAALNYSAPEEIEYKYILEGFDKEWIYCDASHRLATYTNLDPGRYTFKVTAANEDGLWNPAGTSLNISVTPPWWNTLWFKWSVLILSTGLILLLFLIYRHRTRLRQIELEETVKERTRELRQARDRAEEASRAKSRFLSNMSHELRTPLNSIIGYAQILMHKHRDSYTLNGLSVIHQSGKHLLTIINDILDMSRIEAGKLELNPSAMHLPSFIKQIMDLVQIWADEKSIDIIYKSSQHLPDGIVADKTRLRQVLINLLGNAVKFTDKGYVSLSVECVSRCHPENAGEKVKIRFSVEDSGIGIEKKKLETIFQPFEQIGNTKRKAEGTGLGLPISQNIIELMGGKIHVQSPPPSSKLHRGSLFWFELETEITQDYVIPHPRINFIEGYKGKRRTILVVDDKEFNRQLLSDLLKPEGFIVETADNGNTAVRKAAETGPDIIIMDLFMPVKNGFEAVKELKEREDTCHIPVIAISASVNEEFRDKSIKAGFIDFIPKPVDTDKLFSMLGEFLGIEWIYAKDPVPDRGKITPPPGEVLIKMLETVKMGNIAEVEKMADRIKEENDLYSQFSEKMKYLARNFEIKTMVSLLNQFLENNSDT